MGGDVGDGHGLDYFCRVNMTIGAKPIQKHKGFKRAQALAASTWMFLVS